MQNITTMSRYNSEFPFAVAFPPQPMTNVLAEWLAKHDVKQAHVAGNFLIYYMRVTPSMMVYLKKRRNMPM
jgi:bisphosphoglycerate-independent phosphoglycerate mutase (AlkP superfamily)